jgi:hypothetical protein
MGIRRLRWAHREGPIHRHRGEQAAVLAVAADALPNDAVAAAAAPPAAPAAGANRGLFRNPPVRNDWGRMFDRPGPPREPFLARRPRRHAPAPVGAAVDVAAPVAADLRRAHIADRAARVDDAILMEEIMMEELMGDEMERMEEEMFFAAMEVHDRLDDDDLDDDDDDDDDDLDL